MFDAKNWKQSCTKKIDYPPEPEQKDILASLKALKNSHEKGNQIQSAHWVQLV